jgi:iron complex transport system substrate-binding protein
MWGCVQLFRPITAVTLAFLVGCSPPPERQRVGERPSRIVSLDYCADQFVLKLADRTDIVALSPDATRGFSFLRQEAVGVATVRPSAEDILALNPDLIVRSYGGGPSAQAFFERAGIKVHQIGWGNDFAAVRTNVQEAAAALGQVKKGANVIADFDKRLSAIPKANGISALYLTPGGIASGSGSMVDLMMRQAGLTNFQKEAGWHPLPLERLVMEKPGLVAQTSFGEASSFQDYWSSARHKVISDTLKSAPVVRLDGATTACAGWFVMDGVETLAKAGRAAETTKP